jgi:pimeloyl-ACP methyl ester carboxylesterase
LEKADDKDTGPDEEEEIAQMVSKYSIIVVKADGYNAEPEDTYYLRPYNIGPVETYRQFPLYFPELVDYIDANYHTVPDRNHRAISGHSMGGFMTFWIAGKYPHLLSAAGAFCASPEFVVGPKDFPVEYYHASMHGNYKGMKLRHNYGNKDFIRAYHRDIERVWLQVMDNFEKEVYDAGHDVCGLEDMFLFFKKAFEKPSAVPKIWDHIDVYPVFDVRGYQISTDRDRPGFTVLENVNKYGFRSSVRTFLPEGEALPSVKLTILTDSLYRKNQAYQLRFHRLDTKENISRTLESDGEGRLSIEMDGGLQEVGISGEENGPNISISSVNVEKLDWPGPQVRIPVSVELLNKGTSIARDVRAKLVPFRNSASVLVEETEYGDIEESGFKSANSYFEFQVLVDSVQVEKFTLVISDGEKNLWERDLEIPIKHHLPLDQEFEVADGRMFTYMTGGNQSVSGLLGKGNGDGIPNPGESIVVLVRDQDIWWPSNLYSTDEHLDFGGIQTRVSDNWAEYDHVGGSFKYHMPLISSSCPPGKEIKLFAEYWLPDYPDHIIKNGRISITVSGSDQTPPQLAWVNLAGDNILRAKFYDGGEITLAEAMGTSVKNPSEVFQVSLNDHGKEGDLIFKDGIFSKKIQVSEFGQYIVKLRIIDGLGNEQIIEVPDTFFLHEIPLYNSLTGMEGSPK